MEWIVSLECRDKSRVLHERDVARFERHTDVLRPEEVGLSVLDAKALLDNIQSNLVKDQAAFQADAGRACQLCGRSRRIEDYRGRVLRTLFGEIFIRRPAICELRMPRHQGSRRVAATRGECLLGTRPNLFTCWPSWGARCRIGRRLRCCENSCH
jgi:hypothetical protein